MCIMFDRRRGETYRKATATDNEELIAIEIYDEGEVTLSSRNPATSDQLLERRREITGNDADLLLPLEDEVGQYASQSSQTDELAGGRGDIDALPGENCDQEAGTYLRSNDIIIMCFHFVSTH